MWIFIGLLIVLVGVLGCLWVLHRCPNCKQAIMRKQGMDAHGFTAFYNCPNCNYTDWR